MSINYYEPENEEGQKALQEFFDSGLLWAINHGILHQHGYAIGIVSSTETPGIAEHLLLIKVDPGDKDGEILFSQAAGMAGYKKYLDYVHRKFSEVHTRKGYDMDAEGEVHE